MVIRAVGVGATGHHRVDPMRHDVASYEQLPSGLRGGIGRSRTQWIVLPGIALLDRAVDLIGRDLQEPWPPGRRPDSFEEHVHTDDAGPQERLGVEDRPVHVRFRGEVDDRVGAGDQRLDAGSVGDITPDELQASGHLGVIADRGEVRLVAGVRQLVEDRDLRPVAASEHVPDVARADEARPAGDQQSLRVDRHHARRAPITRADAPRAAPNGRSRRRRAPARRRASATGPFRRRSTDPRRSG